MKKETEKKVWFVPKLIKIDISEVTQFGSTGTGIDGGVFSS